MFEKAVLAHRLYRATAVWVQQQQVPEEVGTASRQDSMDEDRTRPAEGHWQRLFLRLRPAGAGMGTLAHLHPGGNGADAGRDLAPERTCELVDARA